MRMFWPAVLGAAALIGVAGCSKPKEEAAEKPQASAPHMEASASHESGQQASAGHTGMGSQKPVQREIVVPDDVKKTWKAVVLELTDRKENKSQEITVNIGETVTVGDLEITVQSFLPAFTMGGGVITSKSNETENPAARLVIKDKGVEVFSGWLFSLYPEAHPFQHERYALLLKDFVKAQ